MAYTTIADVRVTTGFSDDTKITDSTITDAIAYADSTIDSALYDIYELPLTETPELIVWLSLQIATCYLYMNEYGEETENLDKGWEKKLNFLMGILDEIRDQRRKLIGADGNELSRSPLKQPSYYPDAANSATGGATESKLTMNQNF